MAMISMYHPSLVGSTTWVEQEAFRNFWIFRGWLSLDDPYSVGTRYPPGYELARAPLEADLGSDFTAFGELTTVARITVPALQQPIELELFSQGASIGATGDWSIGFVPVSSISVLNVRGARRESYPVNATAGLGIPVVRKHILAAPTVAQQWTIGVQRDSGTATGLRLKGNSLLNGFIRAKTC